MLNTDERTIQTSRRLKAFHIVQWDTSNETAESRKYGVLHWYAKLNKLDGLGISRLRAHDRRVELYCAWGLIEVLASRAPRGHRGWLVRNGTPLSIADMAFLTGFPGSIFELALDFFRQPDMNWLEERELPGLSPGNSPTPRDTGKSPGESPGNSPTPRDTGKKSDTDRQTDILQTDRQTEGGKKKGDQSERGNLAASRTQFAALRSAISELERIPEDERESGQQADLQKKKRDLRRLTKKQAAGDFTPLTKGDE